MTRIKGILVGSFLLINFSIFSQCIEGDCVNGYGKFSCDCGYVFEGEFENGERVTGTLTKKNLVYTGQFLNNMAHGYGIIKYKDGSWYEGTFVENVPVGYGTYHFSNGQRYIGEIVEGSFSGMGIQYTVDKDSLVIETQIGMFNEDRLDGWGCTLGLNGDIHFGNYSAGEYFGFGLFIFGETNTAEAGEYKKKKIYDDELLMNYPDKDLIAVKGYIINRFTYDLVSNIHGDFIVMKETKAGDLHRVVVFSKDKKMLFISFENDPLNGIAINKNGEMFESHLNTLEEAKVILGKQKYSQSL